VAAQERGVLAIAHRAGNSLAGLHGANELDVDVIEADIHHYRGRLEVRHLRTAGPLPFLWDKGQLVSAFAPRLGLQELLEADEHGTLFMLDLKGPWTWTGRAVARLLHDGGHHRPVLVCGRWWPSIDAMAHLPYVRPVLSARNRWEFVRLRRRLERGPVPHGVSVHLSLLDRETVAALHRRVDLVMTWPVNDPTTLRAVLEIGVTGVISDEPDILAEVVAKR
jgi:glycerophosphoryl diester phosphodiesterase